MSFKTLTKAKEERAALIAQARGILDKAEAEGRATTKEENDQYDTLFAQAEEKRTSIERMERQLEAERSLADADLKKDGGDGKRGKWGENEVRARYSRRSIEMLGGEKNEERAYRMGMWTRAMIFQDERAASWCTDNGMDIRGQSEGVFSKGGVLVPGEFSNFIIDLREEYGLARQLLRVVPMGQDTLTIGRRVSGVTAYFVGENGSFTESEKGWDSVTLTAKKLTALCKLSTELAEDAVIDVAADLASEQAYAFGVKEDDCWLNGDGTSTYGGIWGIRSKIVDGTHTQGAIDAQSGHDTFAEIDADDLGLLRGRLPVYAERNARWLVSKFGKAQVFDALAVASGGNTIMSVGERPRPTYLGDQIEVSQAMPAVATALNGSAMILYGDFAMGSTMGDRRGFTLQVLRELYAGNGQIGILGTERFDIVNHDLGSNTVAGPVVALLGKT